MNSQILNLKFQARLGKGRLSKRVFGKQYDCQADMECFDFPPIPNLSVKSHEIFTVIDPAVVSEMLDWFRENERDIYKNLISVLTSNRKLRPVFVQKKSLPEQYNWIRKTLQLRACDTIGEQFMQSYLMSAQQKMLGMFCDGLGIGHDGKGAVSGALPSELDSKKLSETIGKLVDVFDPKIFTLYLHCFNMQVPGGYTALTKKLASDDRLKLA